MPRTKKNSKKYINTRRVRKGGGLMNLIRGKKKNDYKSKIDLIILALGGEVTYFNLQKYMNKHFIKE